MRWVLAVLLSLGVAAPASASGTDVIYRHVLGGSDVPIHVRCSTTGEWRAVWPGQWSTDRCGADYGSNVLGLRVPEGYLLKHRPFECGTCRPWTLGPGTYAPLTPDRAVWLVAS
jgi:hypothetical protein